ncbi:hypothetical protein M9H77_16228 [Catharanthus roseus]|uniref:Uncharacterized protein n=1 Tax=Catharanthus roseus TaxID=4058 RepID=A0ACC0B0N9_CATRO|nr:hypothetical protein M9H77_16228 [Catharanthus roseus]
MERTLRDCNNLIPKNFDGQQRIPKKFTSNTKYSGGQKGQKCFATFQLTNLMHTMLVGSSHLLTTTTSPVFSFSVNVADNAQSTCVLTRHDAYLLCVISNRIECQIKRDIPPKVLTQVRIKTHLMLLPVPETQIEDLTMYIPSREFSIRKNLSKIRVGNGCTQFLPLHGIGEST